MPDEDDGISEDLADVVGEDSILSESVDLQRQPSQAPSKAPSKAPTKPASKAPSDLTADDSFFASGSRLPSRQASKAASTAPPDDSFSRSNDALWTPNKASPPTGAGAAARPPSARPSPPGSTGRPASPLAATPSDDFADLLGSDMEKSSASLPRRPPSSAGSGAGAPAVAAASSRPPSRLSPAPASPSATHTPANRAESLSGFGASSRNGSFHPGSTLAPPEASPSPRASGSGAPPAMPFSARFAAGATGTGSGDLRPKHPYLSQSTEKSRLSQVECHIPTPFELFRLYDADFNGRVTKEEFFSMLRDMDGHPAHYAPHDDPEYRLAGLREKRERQEAARAAREQKLEEAAMHKQTPEHLKREMAMEVAALAAKVSELDAKIAVEEAEARQLTKHPDEAVRVTPELRQYREKWRSWAAEEFQRADLAGNGILSIDEFYMYFYSKMCFRFPVMRTGVNPGALLFNVFVRYCSIGRGAVGGRNEDMLGHQFSKLCRDAGLINGKTLTRASVDIIYHRARAADESLETYQPRAGSASTARMYYPQFLFALDKVAEKRRSGFQEVVARVLSSVETLPDPSFADFLIISGNQLEPGAAVPEFLTRPSLLPDNSQQLRMLADNDMIRKMKEESQHALDLSMGIAPKTSTADGGGLKAFLDSRGTAGANAAQLSAGGGGAGGGGGAPQSLQASVYGSLPPPALDADMLRQKKWERPEPTELGASRAAAMTRGVAPVMSPTTMHLVRSLDPDQLMASLKRVYEAYALWGGGVDRAALDRRRFAKALRDALLVAESGPLPARKAEAVFDKVLPASSRALNFIQFIEALRHVALHHRLSLNEVMERLVAVGSPRPGP